MIQIKPILPSRTLPDARKLRNLLEQASADEAADVTLDLEAPTQTWKHDVKSTITVKSDGISRTVEMRDKIYGYVDQGTRAHVIRPRRARRLRFRAGSRAKTTPGTLRAGSGSQGGAEVFRDIVHHPGTKARGFSDIAAKLSRDRYRKRIQDELERILPT